MKVEPCDRLTGTVRLPGDKSIGHRYAILGGIAHGETWIDNYPASQDCHSTLKCLRQLGLPLEVTESRVRLSGHGLSGLRSPAGSLDAGNSGTTLRLLSGVLAALPFECEIGGDGSLNRRPMRRIIDPLSRMGARISARDEEFPPLRIEGGQLAGIDYTLPVASAQVKSCLLLAGLHAAGVTTVRERVASRDHTERALPEFGVALARQGLAVTLQGGQSVRASRVRVPGDFSAAAFLIVAALLVPGSALVIPDVGLNPTRSGLLQLLTSKGSAIQVSGLTSWSGEPVATLHIRHDPSLLETFPTELGGAWIPNVIDEIPVLAVLGARLPKGLRVKDAAELRKKESDRIAAVTSSLRGLGLEVEEFHDGFFIPPGQTIRGGRVETRGDHRIAMAFAVAGLISRDGVELDDAGCCSVSFPGFFEVLGELRR